MDFGTDFLISAIWGCLYFQLFLHTFIDARRAGGTARRPWGKICPEEMHGIRKEKEVEAIVRSGKTIEETTDL